MASAKIFRINYKSDFILTLESDAGWMTPFCIKFWTGAPSQAYYVGWDGEAYNHCSFDPSEPTKLQVQFDDHHLPIGDLKYQVAYHFTVADFPNDTEDEVINPASITTEIDGETYQVMLDFTGETAPEIQFALPAYANEAQRIANEQQRIAAETQRIANEETRIANEQTRINQEQTRQQNEQQRINQEQARVQEYAQLKADAVAATGAANDAATLAQQKAEYAQQQGGYAKEQGDYAKNQGDYAKEQGDTALADHQRAESDHGIAVDDHTTAASDHSRAESDHTTAAADHTQAGNDHTRAESDHATAAADHTQAGQDHTTAASDHSRAESDHTTAAADHTQAGQDHTTAASDHTQAGNDHTRAESDHGIAAADHTQAGNDHTRAESDHTRAESDHAAVEVYVDSLGAFDISAYHATGGVLAKYADLTAALGTNGANIPEALRKGGMSVKFVQSSDNKYVQYRLTADEFSTDVEDWEESGKGDVSKEDLDNGNIVPLYAKTLEDWADQKAIATPDTYSDAVRTTGGDIPVETSAGSKPESIKPVAGSKWTAKMLFNGSYNMLNAAKWGDINNQPYVGGSNETFVYFLVPELTLGTFGTADENNGLLFTDSEGENVQPTSVYFKPLGATVPQNLTDGTLITPTSVNYDGKTYKTYETSGAGWLIIPRSYFDPTGDTGVCAHIAWEDWYDKYVGLYEPDTNPEAVVGILMLEGLLALAHSDKYLRGVNDEVCDKVVFGDTSATVTHMVDELSVAANSWTNSATGESDSHGNALYRHSATVSGIKQGGAACIEGEDGGIPLTVNGTTVSYVDTNATAPASVVFYEVVSTSTTKAYTDSVFSGSNINTETGVLPINDCSIEAQVAMDGEANITVKYAKNIVDQVAINATVDVPQIKNQVENHEERITELEDTAVRTGSYDASVSVGLADNLRGDTVVNAEFYKRKTGGTQSVGSGIAAIKEVRGKSIVWNQLSKERSGTRRTNKNVTYQLVSGVLHIKPTTGVEGTGSNYVTLEAGYMNEDVDFLVRQQTGHKYYSPNTLPNGFKFVGAFYANGITPCIEMIQQGVTHTFGQVWDIQAIPDTVVAEEVTCPIILFDLTLMFGAGNEPATPNEFKALFPLYLNSAANAGEIIPFAGQNLTTTGKNQYNPATGKANLLGGQTYQLFGTYTDAEIDGVAVTLDSNNCFTTTKDCVLDVTGGNDTDTFVGLYSGETNTYEPYEKHTLPLDPSQWRDKNGELVFPYGGMHGVGTAYDYAKVDADGYIRKAMRVYERRAYESGDVTSDNIITDGRTYTFYPLAEPVEVELATPIYAKYLVDKDGTEEITPANGTQPYTTMANLSILYAMDARGEIKNLPKNYLSKESAENMLNAMVSAGVIASYTMTWDSANSRYVFVIQKNSEQ